MLSFVAHNERENIRQRQAEGIAAAKARGVRFGRPAKKAPEDFGNLVKLWERGYLPLSKISNYFPNISLAARYFSKRAEVFSSIRSKRDTSELCIKSANLTAIATEFPLSLIL